MGTDRRSALGPRVSNPLIKVFENPECHEVYFDIFLRLLVC